MSKVFLDRSVYVFVLLFLSFPSLSCFAQSGVSCDNDSVCEGVENEANCWSDCRGYCVSPEVKNVIDTIWDSRRQYFINYINTSFERADGVAGRRDPYALYNIQTYTNNLLKYSQYCRDYETLDELAGVLLAAYPYLERRTTYVYDYPTISGVSCAADVTAPLQAPASRMWVYHNDTSYKDGHEPLLPSSQFLYMVSNAINIVSGINESNRTQNMKDLASKYAPVAVNDHYMRWIYYDKNVFQVKGWGCEKYCTTPNYNHYDFIKKKSSKYFGHYSSLSYCNLYTDNDMWILAGVVEILAANKKDPSLVSINSTTRQKLLNYTSLAVSVVKSRLTLSTLSSLNGTTANGLNLDLGAWDEHPGYSYSGYLGRTFPTSANKKAADNVGWDISHARRFVHLLTTLYENRAAVNQSFPNTAAMTRFTNQLVYKSFNKNFQRPLFSNYMDGTNGWYRVDYSGAVGFGYPPYGMSNSYMSGGYSLWSRFNPDMGNVSDALWDMLSAVWDGSDPGKAEFARQNYTSEFYNNYARNTSSAALEKKYNRTNSVELLMFLPSLAATTCADECTASERKCSGNRFQACGYYDYDTCLEWSDPVECLGAGTCVDGTCVSTTSTTSTTFTTTSSTTSFTTSSTTSSTTYVSSTTSSTTASSSTTTTYPATTSTQPTTTTTSISTTSSTTATTTTTTVTSTSSTTTTSTTTLMCAMPGNDPPCYDVSLSEVVSAINSWVNGGLDLVDVIDLIDSWADPDLYPPR